MECFDIESGNIIMGVGLTIQGLCSYRIWDCSFIKFVDRSSSVNIEQWINKLILSPGS